MAKKFVRVTDTANGDNAFKKLFALVSGGSGISISEFNTATIKAGVTAADINSIVFIKSGLGNYIWTKGDLYNCNDHTYTVHDGKLNAMADNTSVNTTLISANTSTTKALNLRGDSTWIETNLTVNNTVNNITFSHKKKGTNGTGPEAATLTATPAYGGSFTVVSELLYDAAGHIGTYKTTTVTLPASDNTNQTVKCGGTTFGANAVVGITGGTAITATGNSANNTITVAHKTSGVTAGTYGSKTSDLSFSVPSFTVDAQGHITAASNKAISISATSLGLENAMHFKGTVKTDFFKYDSANGFYYVTDANGNNLNDSYVAGDVILVGSKEYVYNKGTKPYWIELGDEGSHALKTVTITGDGALTGGGSLAANRSITHLGFWGNANGATTLSKGDIGATDQKNITLAIPSITVEQKWGHVTGLTSKSLTIEQGENIRLKVDGDKVIINSTYTDTNTTYSVSTGLTANGTTFKAKLKSETKLGGTAATPNDNANRRYAVRVDSDGDLSVVVPWTDTNINTTYNAGDGIELKNTTFSLPLAAPSTKVKPCTATADNTTKVYPVSLDANGKLGVAVPWTDTNTTYSAGTGLTVSGTTFKAKIRSDKALGGAAAVPTDEEGRRYAVNVDNEGYLSVVVPWRNSTYSIGKGALTLSRTNGGSNNAGTLAITTGTGFNADSTTGVTYTIDYTGNSDNSDWGSI